MHRVASVLPFIQDLSDTTAHFNIFSGHYCLIENQPCASYTAGKSDRMGTA